jgi:hypothetical protein
VKPLRWILGAALLVGALVAAVLIAPPSLWDGGIVQGPTVGEKLGALRAERAALQARADGEARVELLASFRVASLLSDALITLGEANREQAFEQMSATRREAFARIDALNAALKEAAVRPGAGTRQLVLVATGPAQEALERLATTDAFPLVLQFTPRFVPPRRATGELILAPAVPREPPPSSGASVPLDMAAGKAPANQETSVPTVPRYAPSFATGNEEDPPVSIEVVGLRLTGDGNTAPVLTVGTWRGAASVSPERLRFSVPRSAFATDAARSTFVAGSLSLRRDSRTATFELLFTVLPDRLGSFALDQRVRTLVPESRTLVSPEILARGGPGEMRWSQRCFDPPEGWRFDMNRRRVVVVEKMASEDDVPDVTLNTGTVEFADDGKPGQVCLTVTAKPVTRTAKAATIGRFEATLERDRPEDRAVKSGVRALDWREALTLPLDPAAVEWKLYIRLFDEIDREFDGTVTQPTPFLRIDKAADGNTLVLRADPSAEP